MKFRLGIAALRSIFVLLLMGALAQGAPHKKTRARDLADAVGNNVILTKFSAMVAAADLGTFLSSRGPFTLFVPTNSAFSKLPPGMFEDMLLPENHAQLQRIVLFHLVTPQLLDAKDLTPFKSLVSCEGNPLTLRTSKSGTHFVQKARILHADIRCANGIMHQIDTMLMPPQLVLVSKPAGGAVAAPAGNATNAAPPAGAAPAIETNQAPATAAPASISQ